VIIRLLGEGQFEVDDGVVAHLDELDEEIGRAVEAGDEQALWEKLAALAAAVRANGRRLSDEELRPSDAVIPPEDLSLDEARELLADDGFIPDPVAT
jgi:hypothetical protein